MVTLLPLKNVPPRCPLGVKVNYDCVCELEMEVKVILKNKKIKTSVKWTYIKKLQYFLKNLLALLFPWLFPLRLRAHNVYKKCGSELVLETAVSAVTGNTEPFDSHWEKLQEEEDSWTRVDTE